MLVVFLGEPRLILGLGVGESWFPPLRTLLSKNQEENSKYALKFCEPWMFWKPREAHLLVERCGHSQGRLLAEVGSRLSTKEQEFARWMWGGGKEERFEQRKAIAGARWRDAVCAALRNLVFNPQAMLSRFAQRCYIWLQESQEKLCRKNLKKKHKNIFFI